jgi:hypothetical protein
VLDVLVLDLLGFLRRNKPESSCNTSFYPRDGEITRILELEGEREHEQEAAQFRNFDLRPKPQGAFVSVQGSDKIGGKSGTGASPIQLERKRRTRRPSTLH